MATKRDSLGFGNLPSVESFCLDTPLYERHKFDPDDVNPLSSFQSFAGTLDMHCPECGRHSVFGGGSGPECDHLFEYSHYVFSMTFCCSRDATHKATFVFQAHNDELQKIGQVPSFADLALPDLKKYSTLLGDDLFRELTRGIGLAAHGVGVGAFVYLRRIFESLIEIAHGAAKLDAEWDEVEFCRSRMEEKINLLKHHLPAFLVENRGLYGVLSVGVHALSEDECLAAFPAVRLAIEMILDDLLAEQWKKAKVTEAAKSLAALKSNLATGGP